MTGFFYLDNRGPIRRPLEKLVSTLRGGACLLQGAFLFWIKEEDDGENENKGDG